MNSCIYECSVMHSRQEITRNHFSYNYFMFYLDIDEINAVSKRLAFFSRNRFNIFSFRDRDHLVYERPGIRENIETFLRLSGVTGDIGSIRLLTNVATMGYNFNPVSFYFCYDKDGNPICVVPEVGNTFGELKPFYIGKENLAAETFHARIQKLFYVSPFIDHDVYFDFQLSVPDERLNIRIDDYKEDKRIFITTLRGTRKKLTDANLMLYAAKYPFVTLKVIGGIHWQAVKLIAKKVSFFRKNEFISLQQGAMTKWKNH